MNGCTVAEICGSRGSKRAILGRSEACFEAQRAGLSIAEIADRVHLSQTPCWKRIQKLEAYLGLKLLDRTTRRVDLTAVGREFLANPDLPARLAAHLL